MSWSRFLSCVAGLTFLSGCAVDLGFGSGNGPRVGAAVVGDEPGAVHVGADILAQGGNATDAATAMYFALAITYPVAAGLGGGGICLVHDPVRGANEEFDFLARDATGGGSYAIPGNVRGFALMQTSYGALPWQKVVAPAEGFASAGFPITDALATRLVSAEDVIRLDAGLSAEFLDESGHAKKAGTVVANRELAATLASVRIGGADAIYAGGISTQIVAYSAAQGGAITPGELAGYSPARSEARAMPFNGQEVLLPSDRTGAGAFSSALFGHLVQTRQTQNATGVETAVVLATKEALARFGVANLPSDLGATGFAATDRNGQAVACAVTMNGPFGSGHTVQGTGITLARAPSANQAGLSAAFLTPAIATDGDGVVQLAGAGAGGPVGTASIADTLARANTGATVGRPGVSSASGLSLYDTVNVISCADGNCTALPDARSHGLGAGVPQP